MKRKANPKDFIDVAAMRTVCPACADAMVLRGIKAIRFDAIPPSAMREIKARLGGAVKRESCMSYDFGRSFANKESFCDWLHKKAVGQASTASPSRRSARCKAIDPGRYSQGTLISLRKSLEAGAKELKGSYNELKKAYDILAQHTEYPTMLVAARYLSFTMTKVLKYFASIQKDWDTITAALNKQGVRGASTKLDIAGLLRLRADWIPGVEKKKKALAEAKAYLARYQQAVGRGKAAKDAASRASVRIMDASTYLSRAMSNQYIAVGIGDVDDTVRKAQKVVDGLGKSIDDVQAEYNKTIARLKKTVSELEKAIIAGGG